ncbi:MAG: phosphatase PAP2 family protein [Lachnospiraceae bacterium]|nr:phosphatase PAP2 family protein [Lachnospiraceae bacterium]
MFGQEVGIPLYYILVIGELVNGIIKLTVCAYRPWIRSDLIEPAGDSKVAATGYSFPSGHTMVATVIYGTVLVWQKNKRKCLSIICGVLILLTDIIFIMRSRRGRVNYLC